MAISFYLKNTADGTERDYLYQYDKQQESII